MTTNQEIGKEMTRLKERVTKLEREWLEEHRIIEVLVAAGFITEAKVAEARNIVAKLT